MGSSSEYTYLTDPEINAFINVLTEFSYGILPKNFLGEYKEEFIKDVIRRFWITGTAVFTYPCSSEKNVLYDPMFLDITASSNTSTLKIEMHGEDISNNVLAVFNIKSSQHFQGVSIIGSGGYIHSFKPNAFHTACLEAIDLQKLNQKEDNFESLLSEKDL